MYKCNAEVVEFRSLNPMNIRLYTLPFETDCLASSTKLNLESSEHNIDKQELGTSCSVKESCVNVPGNTFHLKEDERYACSYDLLLMLWEIFQPNDLLFLGFIITILLEHSLRLRFSWLRIRRKNCSK